MSARLLLDEDAALAALSAASREALRAALAAHGDPVERVFEACRLGAEVLTLDRVADLLGVAPRTVTETYVARMGLPAHRTGPTSPPWFLHSEVAAWVGALGPGGGAAARAA